MTRVLTLRLHGWPIPIPAIGAALGVDERTARAWLRTAGAHAALRHDQLAGAQAPWVSDATVTETRRFGAKPVPLTATNGIPKAS